MKNNATFIILSVLIYVIFAPQNAYAYLDPGAGSYLLQIVGAFFFAGLFLVKGFWRSIKGFFSRIFKKKGEDTPEKESSEIQ